jgi:hypothetical protein
MQHLRLKKFEKKMKKSTWLVGWRWRSLVHLGFSSFLFPLKMSFHTICEADFRSFSKFTYCCYQKLTDVFRASREKGFYFTYAARMVIMGGIDAAIVDWPGTEENVIRAEVRRACVEYSPGGGFIPSLTYGLPGSILPTVDPIITDEIARYNEEIYGIKA